VSVEIIFHREGGRPHLPTPSPRVERGLPTLPFSIFGEGAGGWGLFTNRRHPVQLDVPENHCPWR